ncbi:MAG: zinc-binding dehydrogenase [Pseudomonadota bacterium]|nr:zinc-binding dehydrogenase [Pseudomonadota bacterium]
MRAVVRRGRELVCDEIETPIPGAGQTLVRTLACGICGSDLHALHHLDHMVELGQRAGGMGGGLDPTRDVVFGHEYVAEILEHGPGGGRFKPGTRVCAMPILMGAAGMEAIGYSNTRPGGFAEQMVLMEPLLLEVTNGLSDHQAAMTEPFAVGAHAVAMSSMGKACVVLVVGCGPVGLAVIAALKSRGLGPVIAADFSPARRKVAEIMGADIVIDPSTESPHGRWSALGVHATLAERGMGMMMGQPGKRAIIFECVGVPGMIQALVEAAPPQSQIVVVGVCMQPDTIEPYLAITKQIELRFVLGYTPDEFAATLHQIAEGEIDVRPTVTSAVGLEGVAAAFKALADPEAQVKIVVEPGRL